MKAKFEKGEWVVRVPQGYDIVEKFHPIYKEDQLKILEQLELCRTTISNQPVYLQKTVSLSVKLGIMWASGGIRFKEDLQKLIFPKGILYDRQKDEFRTEKVNSIFAIIAGKSGSIIENKEGTNQCFVDLSPLAEREGLPPPL